MEFDISRVYTAVNADELKVGSKVIVADTLERLKYYVGQDSNITTLTDIREEDSIYRFTADGDCDCDWALVYLVEEPAKLKWTDLKVGDLVRKDSATAMVTMIDTENVVHVDINGVPMSDDGLKQWEKVDE